MKNTSIPKLIPIMFSFFVMGFVDIVNLSTSYVKQDFGLSDTLANVLPMLVFVWFALVSIPTGILMGRIGRKKTVLLSAAITAVAMMLPFVSYTLPVVLVAFTLLGMGNTILQVSLNPLLMDVVDKNRVTSSLTLGQFIKAICSFMGPVIVGAAAMYFDNWRLVFPIYAVLTAVSFVWLLLTPIKPHVAANKEHRSGMKDVFSLLKDSHILLFFSVIVLLVGYEIGLMTATPKYLQERWAVDISTGGLGLSAYYIARTIGAFLGAIVLVKYAARKFFVVSMIAALVGYAAIMVAPSPTVVFIALFIVGLATSNVFAIVFGLAMQHDEKRANEISSLMITGVAGGALIPPIMGMVSDNTSQFISLFVPFLCLVYIFVVALKERKTV